MVLYPRSDVSSVASSIVIATSLEAEEFGPHFFIFAFFYSLGIRRLRSLIMVHMEMIDPVAWSDARL